MKPIAVHLLVLGLMVAGAARAAPPEIPGMAAGRQVWLGSCEICHAEPASGAPQLGDSRAWTPRLAQAREELYRHALAGFVGMGGGEMPARGGNPALTDDEVRAAVDYMVAASVPPGPND